MDLTDPSVIVLQILTSQLRRVKFVFNIDQSDNIIEFQALRLSLNKERKVNSL